MTDTDILGPRGEQSAARNATTDAIADTRFGGEEVRITKVELVPTLIPIKSAGSGAVQAIRSVVCKIHSNVGLVGVGDSGNCGPSYDGEVQGSIMGVIGDVFAPLVLIGEDPMRTEHMVARMDYLARRNNHAKSIVDFALNDLKGKLLGLPASDFFGGRTVDKIHMGWVVSARKVEDAVSTSVAALENGYALIKLKVGVNKTPLEHDLKRVQAVREAIGDDVTLQLDANCAWTYQQALESLRKFEQFDINMIEQPIPFWDVDGLARLRTKTGIPVFADEAASDSTDLIPLLEKKAVDGLFLKVSKAGGLIKTQRWLSIAEAAGLRVHCGCMAGSGLEAAAYFQILGAHDWSAKFVHENTGPLIVNSVWSIGEGEITDDLAVTVPRYENGYGYMPTGPGLGTELNEEALARYTDPDKPTVTVDETTPARGDGYRT